MKLFVPLLAASMLAAAGCDRAPPGEPVAAGAGTFTDALGRRVAIAVPARRIVTLAPSNTELLFKIGSGSLVVGRDDHSNYPPQALTARALGTAGGRLNRELLVALEPDLVLAAPITSPEEVRSLEKLGLRVFMVENPTDFEGLYENILLLGRLTGQEAAAAGVRAALRDRVAAVAEKVRGVKKRPLVFYELDSTDSSKPWTVGPGTFMHTLLTLSGGENLGARYHDTFPRVSAEEIIREDPEVIILGDARFGVTVDSVRRRAGWSGISAVQSGRVYIFDDDLASRPGPRLVDGLETLSKLLHPELWGG